MFAKMYELPQNVRQVLAILLPASVINDIACFVFYDKHPRDDKNIDIIIYTKSGEVREYYQRSLQSSLLVDGITGASKLSIIRNSECELFYLLSADEQLVILSRSETLQIQQRLTDIERFEVNDFTCSGQSCLKIVKKDDAVPLYFDGNFKDLQMPEMSETYTEYIEDDCLPLISHLKRKLTEAEYSAKCNEKSHKEFLDLRQTAVFSMYTQIHPNLDDSVIKGGSKMMANALKLKFQNPWVKACNRKLIIAFIGKNENNEPLQDVHVLLHGTSSLSMVYSTKLFQKMDTPPCWMANETQTMPHDIEMGIVVVMDLKEIKHGIASKIEFNGVIFYTKAGEECLLPIENVEVAAMDTMGKEFDALSSEEIGCNEMLAILATTEKTDLVLRHIAKIEDQDLLGIDVFRKYLEMRPVPDTDIVIHNSSPYHVLNGIMIIKQTGIRCQEHSLKVSVYTRSPSQVLALLHYIHDAIPLTIIVTTANYTITAKDDQLICYNEENQQNTSYKRLYYAQSILDRNTTLLEYLDDCMEKMDESSNPVVQRKIGTEIHLLAGGREDYMKFRSTMLDKAAEGIKIATCDSETDTMVIDLRN